MGFLPALQTHSGSAKNDVSLDSSAFSAPVRFLLRERWGVYRTLVMQGGNSQLVAVDRPILGGVEDDYLRVVPVAKEIV